MYKRHLVKKIKEEIEKFSLFLKTKRTKFITKNGNIKIIDSEEIKCVRGLQIDQRH